MKQLKAKAHGSVDVALKALDHDDEVGSFEAVLSAPTVDRDGERVLAKAFEPLPDHITIDVDHGMSVGTTVGSGVPFYVGDRLMFQGTFSGLPRAQEVRQLLREGHIRKMSVAFRGAQRVEGKDGTPEIVKAELLNAAVVAVPSNREADIVGVRGHRQHGRSPVIARAELASAQALAALAEAALVEANRVERRHSRRRQPRQALAEAERVLRRVR